MMSTEGSLIKIQTHLCFLRVVRLCFWVVFKGSQQEDHYDVFFESGAL